MSDLLLLVGGAAPSDALEWARVTEAGVVAQRGVASLAALPAVAPARTVLVLPGMDARLKRLALPAKTEAQARAGAEALLGAAFSASGDNHVAIGAAQDEAGHRLVAIISRQRLQEWLARCGEIGADPHWVVLDCSVWPTGDDQVTIATTTNRTIVAGGRLGGFSIERDLAPSLIQRWLIEAGLQGGDVVVQGDRDDALLAALTNARFAGSAEALTAFASGAMSLESRAPNLRQGAFAPQGGASQPAKLWRFAALLLIAALMLQMGSLTISGLRDRQVAAQVLAQAERDFRAARPDLGGAANLRAQVSAALNAMRQSHRHPIVVTADPIVQALRRQPLARVDDVRHEAPSRSVRVLASADQPQILDALVASLREQGVTVQARSMQPSQGRHVMELVLEAPP